MNVQRHQHLVVHMQIVQIPQDHLLVFVKLDFLAMDLLAMVFLLHCYESYKNTIQQLNDNNRY